MYLVKAIVVILIAAFFYYVNAIDLQGSIESSCFEINKTASVNNDWAMSQKIWYYPIMGRYDLYQNSLDLAGKNESELGDDEVYYDSCITLWFAGGQFFVKGFGKTLSYKVNPRRGLEEYVFAVEHEGASMKGTCYTPLTDNKTFMMNACCTSGHMTWGILSTIKQLPEETNKLIYDHAEKLGFKREYFTSFRYGNCKEGFEGNQ